MAERSVFRNETHKADLCIVGGGMAGITAALTAARHDLKVVLMQDRPVLGGNASSEVRVHVCGADVHNSHAHLRETGILEELRLENAKRNPQRSFSEWDALLYEKLQYDPRITLLLNCSCLDAAMEGDRILSVTGWQLTTYTYHTVEAKLFADCSGDGILAPLSGAAFRMGREARSEFGESHAPEMADSRTMGMTCLFQAREHDRPMPYTPPAWAHKFSSCDDLPHGRKAHDWFEMGYWWIELGGEYDSIRDTEYLRDELLKIALGVWDHIKNHCDGRAEKWAIEWLQFLPGKRESVRYEGDHILNQNDIEAGGKFDDLAAYGGWSMDDHHPAGYWSVKIGAPSTMFHKAPYPYGIPYRSLYSKNIANLFVGGRCHSATHMALSSTRVAGTGSSMAQAIGAAAALCVQKGLDPRGILSHMATLQQALLVDDAYLPGIRQQFGDLTLKAKLTALQGDPAPVRDGTNRQVGDDPHAWTHKPGDSIAYELSAPRFVAQAVLALDSGMERDIQMSYHGKYGAKLILPDVIADSFDVEIKEGGAWHRHASVTGNCRRFIRIPIEKPCEGVRYTLRKTNGASAIRMYSFYLGEGNGL
ncbi:MAG: FAD-dependent oxidoreductase [Planctomycetota bacterium]